MDEATYALTLFITGMTPRSVRAVENVRKFCNSELSDGFDLEIVDLYDHPERAQPDNVVVAPTLIRHRPLPVRLLIGDMSDRDRLLTTIKPA